MLYKLNLMGVSGLVVLCWPEPSGGNNASHLEGIVIGFASVS